MSAFPSFPTFAEIDLGAIAHNVRAIKGRLAPATEFVAVVKANAYGHGAVPVAQAALEAGANRLAVARVAEGVDLRRAGIDAPVFTLGHSSPGEAEVAAEHGLALAVMDVETAQAFAGRCAALGRLAPVHVKIDTGMGRYGLLPDEVVPFFARLAQIPNLRVEGVFSHFAVSDSADPAFTQQQIRTFREVLAALDAAGFAPPLRHIANSAAALTLREAEFDAVRVGIALYGLRPSDEVEPSVPLRAALTFKSRVARVRTLPPGASVSYGRTFIAARETVAAVVPVGYGDGYHRLLSNRGAVLIQGQRAPIIGRVCMDQFVVDVTDFGPVALGDEVVLVGRQGEGCIPAEEVARWAETINYEVTTSLLPRVPRVYLRGGQPATP
ncbi:alanine racemase [Aggregatilinea lenta]|uniref:alanine racemase n=1 Tax=Aggregatilinea lenta TaxID=913108 RepID=UPI000E5C1177|nr:alanine racemase [Aggregatilinea lenta]